MTARVATVAGRPIPVSRLDERLAELRRGPRARHLPPDAAPGDGDVRRWVVHELVTEEVLAHEAAAIGILPVAGSARLSPADVADLVAHVTAEVDIGEAEARAYYARNRDLYRRPEARRVRHVLLADEAIARDVAARAVRGADLAALARACSTDAGSASRGGDLGEVRRGELAGPLEDAIFAAAVGTVIGPVRTEHGWHVARVEAVTAEAYVPFAEVRSGIEAELLADERSRAFDAWLAGRRRALALIEPGYEHPAHPARGIPSHRH